MYLCGTVWNAHVLYIDSRYWLQQRRKDKINYKLGQCGLCTYMSLHNNRPMTKNRFHLSWPDFGRHSRDYITCFFIEINKPIKLFNLLLKIQSLWAGNNSENEIQCDMTNRMLSLASKNLLHTTPTSKNTAELLLTLITYTNNKDHSLFDCIPSSSSECTYMKKPPLSYKHMLSLSLTNEYLVKFFHWHKSKHKKCDF